MTQPTASTRTLPCPYHLSHFSHPASGHSQAHGHVQWNSARHEGLRNVFRAAAGRKYSLAPFARIPLRCNCFRRLPLTREQPQKRKSGQSGARELGESSQHCRDILSAVETRTAINLSVVEAEQRGISEALARSLVDAQLLRVSLQALAAQ
jgi:hypothetical protein